MELRDQIDQVLNSFWAVIDGIEDEDLYDLALQAYNSLEILHTEVIERDLAKEKQWDDALQQQEEEDKHATQRARTGTNI